MRHHPTLLRFSAVVLLVGCGPSTRTPAKPSASVATDPHALDSLATLMRIRLTTEEPIVVEQSMVCQSLKIFDKFGQVEARLRIQGMMDTIYKTRADSLAADRADSRLAGTFIRTDSFMCDSLAAANSKKRADSLAQHSK